MLVGAVQTVRIKATTVEGLGALDKEKMFLVTPTSRRRTRYDSHSVLSCEVRGLLQDPLITPLIKDVERD